MYHKRTVCVTTVNGMCHNERNERYVSQRYVSQQNQKFPLNVTTHTVVERASAG